MASQSRRSSAAGSMISGVGLKTKIGCVKVVNPGDFNAAERHYPRVANAALHPTAVQFFGLSRAQMIARYCTLHPDVSPEALQALLGGTPAHFKWGGCDLFVVGPERRCVVVETNSCPSGQKSVPFRDGDELNGYGRLLRSSFKSLTSRGPEAGVLVVMYDKNPMEAGGYAAALADITGEVVYLAESFLTDPDPPLRWDAGGKLSVRVRVGAPSVDTWLPARAALRYVTQKPWSRLPLAPNTPTPLLNPLLPCLAGGRNKMLAARAYAELNARLPSDAPKLRTPATVCNVAKPDVAALVAAMGGCAVVKVPYGNAGQGVYTITNPSELEAFYDESHKYTKFVVQQLVGGREWGSSASAEATAFATTSAEASATATASPSASATATASANQRPPLRSPSSSSIGLPLPLPLPSSPSSSPPPPTIPSFERMYHLGTVPNARGDVFVYDMRMMVCADEGGYAPVAVYARRALEPLGRFAPPSMPGGPLNPSWLQLGTNLSRLTDDLTWTTESERLVMADVRDFPSLGLSVDDLIDGFVQSVLAMSAINDMCLRLLTPKGDFDFEAFSLLNDDPALIEEIAAAKREMLKGA